MIQQTNRYFQNNNWIAIIRLLEPHVEPSGDGWNHAVLLRQLGFAYTQQNQLAKALRCYRRWSELEPDCAASYYCQGYVFYLEKKWHQAITCFEQALSIYPDYMVCLYRQARAFFETNKSLKTIKLLKQALTLYKGNQDEDWLRRHRKVYIKSLFLLGKAYLNRKLFSEALSCFQNVIKEDEKGYIENEHKHYEIAKALYGLERYQEALSTFEQSNLYASTQPYILDQIGRTYHKLAEYEKAIKTYQKALKIRALPFIYFDLALSYMASGKTAAAIQCFHDCLRRDNKGKHKVYLELAKIYLEQKKMSEALHYLQEAIQFKIRKYGKDYADAHYLLVFYYLELGDSDKARLELKTTLEIEPNYEWEKSLSHLLRLPAGDEVTISAVF